MVLHSLRASALGIIWSGLMLLLVGCSSTLPYINKTFMRLAHPDYQVARLLAQIIKLLDQGYHTPLAWDGITRANYATEKKFMAREWKAQERTAN